MTDSDSATDATYRNSFAERLLRLLLERKGFAFRALELDGCRLNYIERSQPGRPTVVLLHGIAASCVHWEAVLDGLWERGYNILAPDLPGHGFSGEHRDELTSDRLFAEFERFLDRKAPGKFFLVGNSLGGALSLRYAIRHPDRLHAIAALSPAGGFDTAENWDAFKKDLALDSWLQAMFFLRRIYARPPLFLPLISGSAARSFNRRGIRQLVAATTISDFAESSKLRQVPVPFLLVWGKSEKLFPARNLESLRQTLPPQAIVEEPEGVGHCPQLDSASWLEDRLHAFFSQVSSAWTETKH